MVLSDDLLHMQCIHVFDRSHYTRVNSEYFAYANIHNGVHVIRGNVGLYVAHYCS